MKALVTGAGGFVGPHLRAALSDEGWESVAYDADVRDAGALREALSVEEPDVVFHLAALSSVPESLRAPDETYEVNAIATARLARVVREHGGSAGKPVRLLFTSSSEVYGARDFSEMPLRETLAPQPCNPYAASKAAAEALLLGEMRALGGDVVIARAFNHIGPGQSERFAVAHFAHALARIAAGGPNVLYVGDLDAQRDVLDVRDVARAYVALARRGERGEAYNVCRGSAVAIRDLLGQLVAIARVPVEVRTDPQRLRPAEIPISFGSSAKLVERTGWQPRIALAQSLRDIYDAAQKSVAS